MFAVVRERVLESPWPAEWQSAGRRYAAKQQIGSSPAAFVTGVPHLQHRPDLAEPRHRDRIAGVEDHDGIGICGGDIGDKLILVARQRHHRLVA